MISVVNSILKFIQIIATSIVLITSSIFHGNLPSLSSLETLWKGTQSAPITTQNNQQSNNSAYNSTSRNRNRLIIRHRQIERIAKKIQNLPSTKNVTSQIVASNIYISAGDTGVSTSRLTMANQIIKTISLPTLNTVVGLSPAKNIQIALFSSPRTYANSLRKAGVDSSSIQSIVEDTGGLTVDTSIWIPLYNLQDKSDLANVLSHELFHACAASQGYGNELPTWINEGTAWRIGLMAMQKVNSQKTSLEMAYYETDVRNAAKNGSLLPLSASENDILNAQYNVEYEDFMAVEQLVKNYGTSTYKAFIQNLKTKNVNTDFSNTFKSSINNFQNSFIKSL
ncbi:hypothetical protein Desaci_1359 [Desulfosporosinus acidiphilus SJ4]|uniref:Peptidase MA-like domain-containing protein n=1 Tax=Desulfosporosinus acidiphilus (strain DSM 22704 / JCM 16185 / SJ4) TaxID=646529 RepID=I4D3K9_DESAJ|nr:hypothetical protein [Desulfosporosinus acidiphilus]AFM40383.1 hypothetical protein Desaci_1359 [Desulfosporosinus acidiphilus SJ4]